jgi:N-acetylmuramoyl-L-alanine amidase
VVGIIGVAARAGTGPAQSTGAVSEGTVVVQPGDSLSSIATAHGVTVVALASANQITISSVLHAGQELVIPPRAARQAGPVGPDEQAPGAAGITDVSGPAGVAGLPSLLVHSSDRLALRPTFYKWANAYGVDPPLVEAVCWMESGWQNNVVSSVGALGIGQLMPATVEHMSSLIGQPLDPAVPGDNIRMSARMLAFLLGQTGNNVPEAVASYAQGLASVQAQGPFPEVQHYVQVVLELRAQFAQAG